MKTRKGRLIWLCVYFLIFLTYISLYFSYDFFTAAQDARMLQLMIYVFLTFILVLLAEWFGAFHKDSPRYKKHIFGGLGLIWLIFLWVLFGDMFNFFR
ncbi:hypothetical protein LIS82_07080 [Cytobacillus solani]|uniref:hypothetical protein n=1 Tax=Cytobacillus solani TaxID=1637975 RepID=UPI002079BC5D|nr:hypothetical protein [Cytobacillus solani]USK56235.1 hypothetical protein LIS82_07080 [Cytobacillus solani]